MKQNKVYIYGKHAALEALLHAPKSILKVYFEADAVDTKLRRIIEQAGIPTARLSEGMARSDIKSGTSHQGVIGQISLHNLIVPYQTFSQTLASTPHTSLVLMSGVQDPHNVGAIIRTAAGFGVSGILMPEKNQAPVTGAVIKVSAGMAFRVPLVSVTDFHATIRDIKKRGFKVYALAGEGAQAITQMQFPSPTLFIFGNEAEGIAPALRALCDGVIAIPINPQCESLNVAAAAAVTLFAWSAQHPEALKRK